MKFIEVTSDRIDELSKIVLPLNKNYTETTMKSYFKDMFQYKTYRCFAIEENNNIIAVASGWITVRLYCGKQLEVDNVIVDSSIQSKGIGSYFFNEIEKWAIKNNCKTIELNTYVANSRSHKFYFNKGYKILGFHFQKELAN